MTPVLQMPYREQPAQEVGPRVFRKQILRTGEIPYKGERLKFDLAYLKQAVESFKAGAFDQVPFVLADAENRHSTDPERFRGEVKALELNGDGIDAIVELTEEGAEIVRKNPRLGVSARLVPDVERDGRRFPVAIEHVCGTLNPRVVGLRPWESVSVRSLSQDGDRAQVIDLSASDYMDSATLTDEQLDGLKGLKPDERAAKARELLGETEGNENNGEPKGESKLSAGLKKLLGLKSDDEVNAALAKLTEDDEPNAERKDDREPVAANLSKEAKDAIDLANSEAADAKREASEARRKVAESEWKLERKDLTDAGVPPAMLNLCEPIFKDGAKPVIDLSNGEKVDAADVIRKLLHEAKGTVDLSEARGSSADKDREDEAKDLASDEKWGASI